MREPRPSAVAARDPFPREAVGTLVRHLPTYARLAWRLGRDTRLSRVRRAAIVAGAAYLVSPIDLVPGVIPVLGQLDDVLVALTALRFALGGLTPADRRRYLDESGLTEKDLDDDRRTALAAAAWIGRRGLRVSARLTLAASRAFVRALRIGARGARALARRG